MKKEKSIKKQRTHRKEIQFSSEEYDQIRAKAFAAGLSEAAYIREASLAHELKAALTLEERKLYQRSTAISSRYLNNLNQLMRISNTFGYSQEAALAILQFVMNADTHLQGGEYEPIDDLALEQDLKRIEREQIARKEADQNDTKKTSGMAEENRQLKEALASTNQSLYEAQRLAAHNYLLTEKGSREYRSKNNIYMYSTVTGDGWFFKIGERAAEVIAPHLVKDWQDGKVTVADLHKLYLERKISR